MSEKRRDSKNRLLQSGESQRKDGRYAYKYTDTCGKPQFLYSWKLTPTDKIPAGKRDDISLRENIADCVDEIQPFIDEVLPIKEVDKQLEEELLEIEVPAEDYF